MIHQTAGADPDEREGQERGRQGNSPPSMVGSLLFLMRWVRAGFVDPRAAS